MKPPPAAIGQSSSRRVPSGAVTFTTVAPRPLPRSIATRCPAVAVNATSASSPAAAAIWCGWPSTASSAATRPPLARVAVMVPSPACACTVTGPVVAGTKLPV